MRITLAAAALALLAVPATALSAQDHEGHDPHRDHKPGQTKPADDDDPHKGHRMPMQDDAQKQGTSSEPMDHDGMDHGKMDHGGMDHGAMGVIAPKSDDPPPPRAFEGPRHAADAIWGEQAMAVSRQQLAKENGGMTTGVLLVERLEARIGDEEAFLWDVQGWYGGDINRFFLKSEGEGEFGGSVEDAEIQFLFSRAIAPFFDLQAGARVDLEPETRTHLALGIQGLAPYMFHVDGALFLSDRGDLTARLEGEYDQKITQQLILQPRAELELSAQDIPEREIGAGLTKFETGLRLRYEIAREFAPYIGVGYEAKLGGTADIARAKGEDTDGFVFLAGLRAWF